MKISPPTLPLKGLRNIWTLPYQGDSAAPMTTVQCLYNTCTLPNFLNLTYWLYKKNDSDMLFLGYLNS